MNVSIFVLLFQFFRSLILWPIYMLHCFVRYFPQGIDIYFWECWGEDAWCSATKHEDCWPHFCMWDDLTIQPWVSWRCAQFIATDSETDQYGRIPGSQLRSPLSKVFGVGSTLHQRREGYICEGHSWWPWDWTGSSRWTLHRPQCWKTSCCSCSRVNYFMYNFIPLKL